MQVLVQSRNKAKTLTNVWIPIWDTCIIEFWETLTVKNKTEVPSYLWAALLSLKHSLWRSACSLKKENGFILYLSMMLQKAFPEGIFLILMQNKF